MKINDLAIPVKNPIGGNGLQPQIAKSEFGNLLSEALTKVNDDLIGAEKLTQDFTLGKNVELHQVIAATEQANLALQLTIQIRNKVIEAYQEVTRMQV